MKSLLTTTAAALFVAGAALAQEAQIEWDVDADTQVTQEEFTTNEAVQARWAEWDTDRDEALSEEEIVVIQEQREEDDDQFFNDWFAWDEDEDRTLSREEFDRGVFTSYDRDADSVWSQEETVVVEDDGWF